MANKFKGKLFLILGPSGVGKGTVVSALKKKHPEFLYPVSETTRKKRSEETEGEVYHYLKKEDFKNHIMNDEFLEWALVHKDNYYGTLKKPVIGGLILGKTIVREIDIQGFEQVREKLPKENLVSIFLMPPDFNTLKRHIYKRGKMSKEEFLERMRSAKRELDKKNECDYQIISEEDRLEKIVEEIERIIAKEIK